MMDLDLVMNKREKFLKLYRSMERIEHIITDYWQKNNFKIPTELVKKRREFFDIMMDRRSDDSDKDAHNSQFYQEKIEEATKWWFDLLSYVDFPIISNPLYAGKQSTFNTPSEYLEDLFGHFLHAKEILDFDSGSNFESVLYDLDGNKYFIKKYSRQNKTHIYGLMKSIDDNEFNFGVFEGYSDGRYSIRREGEGKEYRFDINSTFSRNFNMYADDYNNPIYDNEECFGIKRNEDYVEPIEPDCPICGDGGCVHCRPSWFM